MMRGVCRYVSTILHVHSDVESHCRKSLVVTTASEGWINADSALSYNLCACFGDAANRADGASTVRFTVSFIGADLLQRITWLRWNAGLRRDGRAACTDVLPTPPYDLTLRSYAGGDVQPERYVVPKCRQRLWAN